MFEVDEEPFDELESIEDELAAEDEMSDVALELEAIEELVVPAVVIKPDLVPDVRLSQKALSKGIKPLNPGPQNVGMYTFVLPDVETQKVGFHLGEHAGIFVDQFPQYKFLTPKGTTTPSVIKS